METLVHLLEEVIATNHASTGTPSPGEHDIALSVLGVILAKHNSDPRRQRGSPEKAEPA